MSSSSSAPPPVAPARRLSQLRLHICGMDMDYAAGSSSGTNGGGGDRATTSFGNACLDLFLLDADAPPQHLRGLLADAWDQDALTALKLVCHRHTVKRDKEGFFAAATWMLQTHPRVFVGNLPAFAELCYVQDLAGLLDRLSSLLVHDHGAAPAEESAHVNLQRAPAALKRARDDDDPADAPATTSSVPPVRKRARHDDPGASATAPPSDVPLAAVADPAGPAPPSDEPAPGPEAAATRENLDLPYRTLYDAIVDFFVDRLSSDLDHLNNGNTSMISLAANWCPNMGSPSDQTTLLRMDIARRLFPRKDPMFADLTDEVCDKYVLLHLRHSVLQPLVSALHEQKQQASEPKVRSKLPHLIAGKFGSEVWKNKSSKERKEITEEWRTMVGDLRAKGSLRNCIAVCDVSPAVLKKGNSTKLLQVCVALGLLIPELSKEPWKDWVHAFSKGDGRHSLADKTSYYDKVEAIRGLKCDANFNLRRVLEWVLSRASLNKVEPRDMVKTILVFTGKDFEQAIVPPESILRPEDRAPEDFDPENVRRWRDDYRIVCQRFKEHDGYDDRVPGVVLWDLRGDRSAALTSTEHDGVLSLSGYSDDLLRLFLEKGGVVHANDEMNDAIAGEEYQKLDVKDVGRADVR